MDIDEKLFQRMMKMYSDTYGLPPLASKIFTYIVFDFDERGFVFDDFVKRFSASKSSVSTSLKLLISKDLIYDTNKIDERKKYYYLNPDFVKIRMQKVLNRLKNERDILADLAHFFSEKSEECFEAVIAHKTLLDKNIENIEETLDKV